MKTSAQIRSSFLDFYVKRGHTLRASAPLIPQGDPTLMFNSAGMVPFKPYFLGLKKDLSRATSCQKCFRTTDIDRVGMTLRHLTFFEMLGNFSFGDYFKTDAIAWAWELLTKELGFDPKLLHPTVFVDDSDAEQLWKKQSIVNPVTRLGEESNFWAAGPTGPCGPCSEIYFDRGPEHSCGKPTCAVGCDCDRYLEIWNLVFMQYKRGEDGKLTPLPKQNIDTGAGLERVTFALQGKPSPFDTDLFKPIMDRAAQVLGKDPNASEDSKRAFRVIADHSRAATMLMAEGVIPSNADRGYVLRRLIRRALRYGQLLGYPEPFLHKLVPATIEIFASGYPELKDARAQVESTLKTEETKFLETLAKGQVELEKLFSQVHGAKLPGDKAFWLYETYGFPLELTKEIAAERKMAVDEQGFKDAALRAADVARASWKGSGEKHLALSGSFQTQFTGYESIEEAATVVAFQRQQDFAVLVLDKTPFYPEGGGQVGDEGVILSPDGARQLARVLDTQKQGTAILHVIKDFDEKALAPNRHVLAKVDAVRRSYIKPHHTGTHLLNEALRRVLGAHVRQAGSYVGADKLRFDFTHPKALDHETLQSVEKMVADEIKKGDRVETRVDSVEKVKELGAVTLLGEDYGQRPRFVLIGEKGWQDPMHRYSLELCGGTHCATTAELGRFKIVKESSVAAGVRRIEALAGKAVDDYDAARELDERLAVEQLAAREEALLNEIHALGGKAEPARERTEAALRVHEKELKELVSRLKEKKLSSAGDAGRKILEVKGVKLCAQRFDGADAKQLRPLSDRIKAEVGSGLVFLAASGGGKLSFVLAATPDLASKGVDAAKIAKAFAAGHGGSAGGRADFAQGGVADADWDKVVAGLAAQL